MTTVNRKYKDRLFRLFFGDEKNKANTLALYNALNHSSYSDEEALEITTIEDAIYIKMKNDISFMIADTMNLYEQQSSHNPNMPLRGFIYYGSLYAKYLEENRLTPHAGTLVKLPTPNYIVFYNGTAKRPAIEKLRLSDAFQIPDNRSEFEWTATVINLNHEENTDLLERCKPLGDYTTLVSKIQTNQKTMPIEEAVNQAIDDCISNNILAEFLRAHRAEVVDMYLSEVNEDFLREQLYREGRADGREELLLSKIQKKLSKGKTLEQIADELEEDIENIRSLYEKLNHSTTD